ncbi:MAG: Rid family detoxifying hydrolase [Desulfovibrio sp.]|uniref:Rid family detoxifying hydrolase n=1 Tax=Desulfovibrio sp. 7SRBS1 TaxID=3378064 RepID=UPI003B3E392C
MSICQFVATSGAPAAIGPYSQGVQAGSLVLVSGQLGLDPEGSGLAADFASQARLALSNCKAILAEAGCGIENIVSVDVFVTNLGRFQEFNAIYAEFMGEHRPARAVIEVSALPLGGLVEVKCMAVKS